MKTTIGTSHFLSFSYALNYYRPYLGEHEEACRTMVEKKLQDGEIHIGQPALKTGEKLLINREEGRYFIQS